MIRLLMTMGDPAGIGLEVLLLSLNGISPGVSVSVVGDHSWLVSLARRMGLRIPWSRFQWIDAAECPKNLTRGRIQPLAGKVAYDCLRHACTILKASQADGVVTAPVSKEAIVRAGIPWIGHTEFLGDFFHCKPVMMFVANRFRVSLVTTHVGIKDLPATLKSGLIQRTIRATQKSLKEQFGIKRPRIGVAALNPHGGEGGLFGTEEKRRIAPVLKACGDGVDGPLPADSLMRAASRGDYDGVVALYHDQALIPVKLLGWEQAVNVTLGLPFVRTSPVHGTAFDIALTSRRGRSQADPRSMVSAIGLAIQLCRRGTTSRNARR